MANVYLAFHETDQAIAQEIAAALTARGHTPLVPRSIEDADGYRNTADIMIIIATPQGLASPFVQEDARVSRHHKIPRLIFKHLEPSAEMLRPFVFDRQSTDIDTLLGHLEKWLDDEQASGAEPGAPAAETEIGAMSTDRGDAIPSPAPAPRTYDVFRSPFSARKSRKKIAVADEEAMDGAGATPPNAPQSASVHEGAAVMDWMEMEQAPLPDRMGKRDGEALKVEEGKLVHKVGEQMRKGRRETVEARLGRVGTPNLALNLAGSGQLVEEDLAIVETMTVELISPDGAFEITPQTKNTQLVAGELLQNTGLDMEQFGRWLWTVEPMEAGKHELIFKVSADILDGRGMQSSAALPDRLFKVEVSIDYGKAALTTAKWFATGLAGMILAGLIGAYTQEVWWPHLKLWLGL